MLHRIRKRVSISSLPQKASGALGGFIHVGKTGGSTLSLLLRNACHHRSCGRVKHESVVSKSTAYYHTHNLELLSTEPHEYYVWTARDPFARTISAFLYTHPYNVYVRQHQYKESVYRFPMQRLNKTFSRCFKTLNSFAQALKHPYQREAHISLSDARKIKCDVLANAMFQHKAERLSVHLHNDFRMFQQALPANATHKKAIFVIRTEFLWRDWVTVNELLGQSPETIFSDKTSQLRNTSKYKLPVKPIIGEEEREYLCRSIEPEYHVYLDILSNAINLDEDDVVKMKEIGRQNCPQLQILQ